MWRLIVALFLTIFLFACGSTSAPTADQVEAALGQAGATAFKDNVLQEGAPVPRSFQVNRAFEIASVAPKGGQYFICDSKRNCDAIFAYFDALKALAGPYLYQSPSGLVVAQLNSGLTPAEAAKYEQAIKGLP